MLKKLCVVAFLAVVGCGGGGGGGGDDDGGNNPPPTPTLTLGSTVVAAGEAATVHAAVGDTLTLAASEVIPSLTFNRGTGTSCSLQFPNGLQSGVDTYTFKINAGTDQCVFQASFDEGDATITVLVP